MSDAAIAAPVGAKFMPEINFSGAGAAVRSFFNPKSEKGFKRLLVLLLLVNLVNLGVSGLVFRQMSALRAEMRSEFARISALRAEMRSEFARIETDITELHGKVDKLRGEVDEIRIYLDKLGASRPAQTPPENH